MIDINNSDRLDSAERIAVVEEPTIKSKLFNLAYKYSISYQSIFKYSISIMQVNGVIILTVNNIEIYKSLPIAIYNEDRNIMEWIYNDINLPYKKDINNTFVHEFKKNFLEPFCIENNIPYISCRQMDRSENLFGIELEESK